MPTVGCYKIEGTLVDVSNSFLTNRSMIEVLPTPESPRKTILNLVSQRLVL